MELNKLCFYHLYVELITHKKFKKIIKYENQSKEDL